MKLAPLAAGLVLLGAAAPAAAGYELICKGGLAGGGNTPVIVDCSDRRQVEQALHDAWQALLAQGIGDGREERCGSPYRQALELPPATDIAPLAGGYFVQCNVALKLIRRGL